MQPARGHSTSAVLSYMNTQPYAGHVPSRLQLVLDDAVVEQLQRARVRGVCLLVAHKAHELQDLSGAGRGKGQQQDVKQGINTRCWYTWDNSVLSKSLARSEGLAPRQPQMVQLLLPLP